MNFFDIHTHQFKVNSVHNWLPGEGIPDQMCSVGLHPWYLERGEWEEVVELSENSHVVFVGETGLDYASDVDRELQLKFFKKHIELAKKLKKPLILHCVKAYSDCLRELQSFGPPVIFHDYNGGEQETSQILKRPDTYLSFGATLFRENSKVLLQLSSIPLERIFLETDDSERSIESVYRQYIEKSGHPLDIVTQQLEHNLNKLNIL